MLSKARRGHRWLFFPGLLFRVPVLAPHAAISSAPAIVQTDRSPIQHFVVIYQENHSFDNLFAGFPGANESGSTGAID